MYAAWKRRSLRKKLGPPVVVVSGLPRSGTSMMMKMLEAGGLDLVTDHRREADEDNPKGYFEFEAVKELDKAVDKSWLLDCRGKVVKIICFLLQHLPDDCYYKVLFMRRKLEEVVASQNKMLDRRGEPRGERSDEEMIRLYRRHLRRVDVLLEERLNFELLDVDYGQVLQDPLGQAKRIAPFVGVQGDPERMAMAVDPRLYRNRK